MFQDTLLIIKCDYMAKRKSLLIFLTDQGFQIQGHRRVQFTPELAAEFYQDRNEEPNFMFHVILLSKGPAEAFILAKENAVEDLISCLVCYFGNSIEMEKNVHVTRCLGRVRKEIRFIYPNYIFEPIDCFEQVNISCNNPFVSSLIGQVYEITTKTEIDPHKSWKQKLAEWLILSNKDLPQVSNQCVLNPSPNVRNIAQQTKMTFIKPQYGDQIVNDKASKSSGMGFDTDGTSLNITTSSCMTCSDFASSDIYFQKQDSSLLDLIKSKTVPLNVGTKGSSISEEDNPIKDIDSEILDQAIVAIEDEMLSIEMETIATVDVVNNVPIELQKPDINPNEDTAYIPLPATTMESNEVWEHVGVIPDLELSEIDVAGNTLPFMEEQESTMGEDDIVASEESIHIESNVQEENQENHNYDNENEKNGVLQQNVDTISESVLHEVQGENVEE
ncbi:uncharacterized protein LOC142241605 [Haematobia irritans]|uniref:uncharacterized protein LOC142241605 n=1 Tax=Haematobia irritans TaxID=7368 RepID=UPI003F4F5A45